MARLNCTIMAHPKRKSWVPSLQNKLGGAGVVWDRKNSRWDTGRRALLAHEPGATHHLIVQDDAVLSNNFLKSCRNLVEHSGEFPVALYMGSSSPGFRRKAIAAKGNGTPWFLASGPRWGVAVIIPVAHIPDLVEWCDADKKSEAYDGKMTLYYMHRRLSCLYTVPSLVNHREVTENPSLMPNRNANRTAFLYRGTSATKTDWSIPPDSKPARVKVKFFNPATGQKRLVNMYGPQYNRLRNNEEWVTL